MSIIVCNIDMMSYSQTVYVIDDKEQVIPYTCTMENIQQVLNELSKQYGVVKLYGNENFVTRYAQLIKEDNTMNYNNYPVDIYINDIKV